MSENCPVHLYKRGMSIPQVSQHTGIPKSAVRKRLIEEGVIRTQREGLMLAAKEGRLGVGFKGKRRKFSQEHCDAISRGRTAWGDENAVGVSLKPNGYLVHTRGPHKGKAVHIVAMEERLGRTLLPDECVHHIDGIKTNNDLNNLALLTRSGHARLHRREQRIRTEIE